MNTKKRNARDFMKKYVYLLLLVGILSLTTIGCTRSRLTEISYNDYKKLLEDKETFVLEVMKNDCTACKGIKPKLKKISDHYNIEIRYIDLSKLTDEQIDSLGVAATPTIIFYTKGEEETTTARVEGNVSEKKIIEKFKASNFIND